MIAIKSKLFFKIRRLLLTYVWWIYCFLEPKKIANFILVDGSHFEYPLKSAIGCCLFTGEFEAAEVAFLQQALKEGDIFFDVGANGGLFTIIAAKKIGTRGHVYAFEPGQREIELLRRNIALNNLKNVTIVERAVSNKNGTAQLAVSYDGAMNSLAATEHPRQQIEEWQTVEMISIDEFIKDINLQKVDFLKVDVEGAEKLVIEGAKNTLVCSDNLTILLEASNLNTVSFGYSAWELLSELIDSGFFIYYFDRKGNLSKISDYDVRFGGEIYNFIASKKLISV